MKVTLGCPFDTLLMFETYDFHVGAIVGDGASWNQTLAVQEAEWTQ